MSEYHQARKIFERLARENPADSEYQSSLAGNRNRIGDLGYQAGKLDEALTAFQRSLSSTSNWCASTPHNRRNSASVDLLVRLWINRIAKGILTLKHVRDRRETNASCLS